MHCTTLTVIPAQAGIHGRRSLAKSQRRWIPACAGMTADKFHRES